MIHWNYLRLVSGLIAMVVFGACEDEGKTITLSGEVIYEEYTEGEILIRVCEDETAKESLGNSSAQTPGKCVAETVLSKPGSFLVDATLISKNPKIDVLVYLLDSADQNYHDCTAGVYKQVAPKSQDSIALSLETGTCPLRK